MHKNIAIEGGSRIDSTENIHQGGFACPVLSNYGMDFSRTDLKVHIVESPDPGEGLGDVFHFQ
jgi:hypothetical protein